MEWEKATLRTLADGEAISRFDHELALVVENIADPETPADARREITLKVIFSPNHDRSQCNVAIQVSSKLAPDAPAITNLQLARTDDGPTAFEHQPKQLTFDDFTAKPDANRSDVTKLTAGSKT